ncbi:hypothetical protein GGX14DRAFT_399072 [Mycena pura]|uniref:Uncharacterized protein n=1 Tax=Mycena pura TaxID=153505 RepID=A0AAD6YCZ3_9AGAR|nr:hypothetical protein GGX14DRAFT_399072 [Mycena pura]
MARPFKLSNVLFSPNARVYTLRLLLLADVVITVLIGMSLGLFDFDYNQLGLSGCKVLVGFIGGIVIGTHHVLVLFWLDTKVLAVIDLVLVFFELGGYVGALDGGIADLTNYPVVNVPAAFVLIPTTMVVGIASLAISAVFRISTICKTQGNFVTQRFAFLGCCGPVYPPYTVTSILLNRAVARPLVSLSPTQVVTQMQYSWVIQSPLLGNASFVVQPLNDRAPEFALGQISVYGEGYEDTTFNCSLSPPAASYQMVSSVSKVGGVFLFMPPWYSKPPEEALNLMKNPGFTLPKPMVLLPGSRLFGLMTWTGLHLKSSQGWKYQPEILGLQQNPSGKTDDDTASLTLHQIGGPFQIFQEASDSSILSGITKLGGFWTFVNGAFALLFGANIIYFAFGRRPLSALGVAHLFQRQKLVHQWHEDFPALRTEGGLPGSESAGIVAFIRQSLQIQFLSDGSENILIRIALKDRNGWSLLIFDAIKNKLFNIFSMSQPRQRARQRRTLLEQADEQQRGTEHWHCVFCVVIQCRGAAARHSGTIDFCGGDGCVASAGRAA